MTNHPASVLQRHSELSHSFCCRCSAWGGAVMALHALQQDGARKAPHDACVAKKGVLGILCAGLLLLGSIPETVAQRAQFVVPPRTIADITAILDQEKPDPAKRAKVEADAIAEPPAHADAGKLKDFYFRRAQARASVGRLKDRYRRLREGRRKCLRLRGRGKPNRALSRIPNATEWGLQGSHRTARKNGAKIEGHPAAQ